VGNPTQKTDPTLLDQILTALKEGQTFCFSGHRNPDADVIGSQLALASLIKRIDKNKKVTIQNSGRPAGTLSFLKDFSSVKNVDKAEGSYDVLIVFECSGADRMGNIIDFKTQVKKVINIDHHLHNPNFGHINFVEPATSSTSELIFKIFERAGVQPDRDEAIALYTGITADTGWFRYGNTNSQTHEIASQLLTAGVPVAELAEKVYMSRSEPALRILGWVLTYMKFHFDNRVSLLTLPQNIFVEFGATPEDLDEVVNFGLLNKTSVVSVLLKEREDKSEVKISLRSKGEETSKLYAWGIKSVCSRRDPN